MNSFVNEYAFYIPKTDEIIVILPSAWIHGESKNGMITLREYGNVTSTYFASYEQFDAILKEKESIIYLGLL